VVCVQCTVKIETVIGLCTLYINSEIVFGVFTIHSAE